MKVICDKRQKKKKKKRNRKEKWTSGMVVRAVNSDERRRGAEVNDGTKTLQWRRGQKEKAEENKRRERLVSRNWGARV